MLLLRTISLYGIWRQLKLVPTWTVVHVPTPSLLTCLLMANFLCQIPLWTTYFSHGLAFFFSSVCPRQVFASLLDHERAIILPLSVEGNDCHPVCFSPLEVYWRQQAFGKNENEVATSYHGFMRLFSNASDVFQYCWLLQLKCQDW